MAEKLRLEEVAKDRAHDYELEQERFCAEFRDRKLKMEHELKMKELELEQQLQETELQHWLDELAAHKTLADSQENVVQGSTAGTSGVNAQNNSAINRNAQIGMWLDGVQRGDG